MKYTMELDGTEDVEMDDTSGAETDDAADEETADPAGLEQDETAAVRNSKAHNYVPTSSEPCGVAHLVHGWTQRGHPGKVRDSNQYCVCQK